MSVQKSCETCFRDWVRKSSDDRCPYCRVTSLENAIAAILPKITQVTARHRHGTQIPRERLDDLSNAQIELEDAMALKERFTRPDFRVSAVYFPGTGEAELSYENNDGETLAIVVKVNKPTGEAIARHLMPCIYQTAEIKYNG